MSPLRLGAYKLPAAEVVLVQTLFRLYAHGSAFRWSFVTAPPYDALLVDGTTGEPLDAEIAGMARAVLRLTRMNAPDAPNTLQRPIRADRLQEWLRVTELQLLDTQLATQPAEEAPAAATPGKDTAAAAATAAASAAAVRFKLRRWPPASLLRGDAHRIRMATLLSRRALSAAELADISQQPVQACQAFLQNLQTLGLVELPPAAPPAAAVAQPAADARAAAPAPAKPSFARGLISGIRRRLGL
ncbi:MAG: hypothetical protein Q4F13_01100 [Pseudomonadota bacterium]|nr:hypothetical protein [Pseudomonadota bacterium]